MARSVSYIRMTVKEISAIEADALRARSAGERFGDLVVNRSGRISFIVLHVFWFVAWLVVNSAGSSKTFKFDPLPYPLLTLVVSLESIFLSLFILMSQNRSSRTADERAHLDLQINLLAEHESTKALQLLQALCRHHGLGCAEDPNINQLVSRTKPVDIIRELKKSLPTTDEG